MGSISGPAGSKNGPKMHPRGAQGGPRDAKKASETDMEGPGGLEDAKNPSRPMIVSPRAPFWSNFGANMGLSWAQLTNNIAKNRTFGKRGDTRKFWKITRFKKNGTFEKHGCTRKIMIFKKSWIFEKSGAAEASRKNMKTRKSRTFEKTGVPGKSGKA